MLRDLFKKNSTSRVRPWDGTGPHGRGLGPGQGRADGTGLAKK